MCKVLIFGGTTEGRILAEYCSENRIPAYVSVVSEYGRELLKEDLYVRPLTGPMDAGQMRAFIADEAIELVVDATHPYARNATENIKSACRDTGTAYLRYLRNTEDERENAGDELFSTPEEAAKWLEETKGNIFVTTGSNELAAFAGTEKLKHRIFARVLPSSFAVGKCEELGITGKHLICMQGPFTKEMNAAMLREYCRPDAASAALLERAMERLNLSARAYDRIIKVARTIADLDRSEAIRSNHIAEAIRYRSLDRASWGA